jgi:hypothetical protein
MEQDRAQFARPVFSNPIQNMAVKALFCAFCAQPKTFHHLAFHCVKGSIREQARENNIIEPITLAVTISKVNGVVHG